MRYLLCSLLLLLPHLALAQTIQPPFNSTYTAVPLGRINGLPERYGGLVFKRGDPNTILIGGQANSTAGRFFEVPLVRNPVSRKITGFGTPVATGFGGNNDGGVAYHPSGVLFYSRYSLNEIGMVAVGSNTQSRAVSLTPFGVSASPGALTFVPPDLNGGGRLKVMSYGSGNFYDVAIQTDGNGTFNVTGATLRATLQGGPEGMIYLPQGSPVFGASQTLLVTEYNGNAIVGYSIDAEGNPILSSRRVFLSGLTGGEGAAIDPVTGDFLFSTFGTPNQLIRVEGFLAPASVSVTSSANPAKETLPLSLTATITGVGSITGTVTFRDGTAPIAGCESVPVSAGVAVCTTTTLRTGNHRIAASYSGNTTNAAGNASLEQVINPLNTAPVAGPSALSTVVNFALGGVLVGTDIDGDDLRFTLVPGSGPAHGSISNFDPVAGTYTYTPDTGYQGADSFDYTVTEARTDALSVLSARATAQLTVLPPPPGTPGNRTPLAANDLYATDKGVTLTVLPSGVLANDVDLDGDPLQLSALPSAGRAPSHGTVQPTRGGGFVYVPDPGFVGTDSFGYDLTAGPDTVTATVSIVIQDNGVNVVPRAVDDSFNTPDNVPLSVASPGVLDNDIDADRRQPLLAVLSSPPSRGTVALAAHGGFVYTATSQCTVASGQVVDSFTYLTYDGIDYSAPATVSIALRCSNQPPTALNDVFSTPQNAELFVPARGVLDNDLDPESNPLQATLVSGTTQGAVALYADGSFRYRPGPGPAPGVDFQDSFTYLASDGLGNSQAATVTLQIAAVNQPPLAGNDLYSVTRNRTVRIAAPGVLGNDIDPENHALSSVSFTPPANGVLHPSSDGGFDYTPNPGFIGLDSFGYRASDGGQTSNLAQVGIIVLDDGINAAPVAADDAFVATFGRILSVPAPGLLANDADADPNQPIRAVLLSQPASGSVVLTAGGGFDYTPAAGNCAADSQVSFRYVANDSVDDSAPATVTITIRCNNQPPTAVADAYATPRDTELVVPASGLLANDTDPDGNPLTARIERYPANGALALQADGSFRYRPAMGFTGADTFSYRVFDGALTSAVAPVSISVSPVNQPPLAGNDQFVVEQNRLLQIAPPGLLANDLDPENHALAARVETLPLHGTLSLDPQGGLLYVPNTNYVGLDSFTYRVSDGDLTSPAATVVIQVSPATVNVPPIAVDDRYNADFLRLLSVPGPGPLANDNNPDGGQPLSMVIDTNARLGDVKLTAGGGFDYVPAPGTVCTPGLTDSFTYFAFDGTDRSSGPATVTISIACGAALSAPVLIPVMQEGGLLALILVLLVLGCGTLMRWHREAG